MKKSTILFAVFIVLLLVGTSLADPNDLGSWGGGNDLGNWGGGNDLGPWAGGNDLGSYLNEPGYNPGNNPDTGNIPPPPDPQDPIGGNPLDPPTEPMPDYPAKWNELQDQTILWNSPDNTLVYEDLKDQCQDIDTPVLIFQVVSQHPNYELFFDGNDLLIKDLTKNYASIETVVVECNSVKASFQLTVGVPGAELPVANAGGPYFGHENEPVLFDASQSTDNKGIALYHWNFGDGYEVTTQDSSVYHTYEEEDQYLVTLTVTDTDGFQDSDTTFAYITEEDESIFPSERTIFSRIRYDDYAQAGDIIEINVGVFNDGTYDMEDMKVSVHILSLAERRTIGPFDIDDGEEETANLYLEIPVDAQPGEYDLRIVASNDNFRHFEHRVITIV